MDKLYRTAADGSIQYWETWQAEPGSFIIHWGELGSRGESKTVQSGFLKSASKKIDAEYEGKVAEGFAPILPEDHAVLMIEYPVDGMGSEGDLEKRHALEGRMNELMGWTGLGACDGGSIGSGSMEVCNFVVDYDTAERVIRDDLAGTEFGDFTRIYQE